MKDAEFGSKGKPSSLPSPPVPSPTAARVVRVPWRHCVFGFPSGRRERAYQAYKSRRLRSHDALVMAVDVFHALTMTAALGWAAAQPGASGASASALLHLQAVLVLAVTLPAVLYLTSHQDYARLRSVLTFVGVLLRGGVCMAAWHVMDGPRVLQIQPMHGAVGALLVAVHVGQPLLQQLSILQQALACVGQYALYDLGIPTHVYAQQPPPIWASVGLAALSMAMAVCLDRRRRGRWLAGRRSAAVAASE